MKIFRTLLRVVIGALFVGHGTQKLFGLFGGAGLKATAEGFDQMGMRPGMASAIAAGAGEAGGGILLATGFMTPVGAASIIATMLTAIHRVHLKNGPWITNGGYEYNLVLILTLLTIVEEGPGPVSIDALKGQERKGTGWALATLAGAAAGSGAAHAVHTAMAPPEQP
ncbi:MAG TPA: DoxX family protein [Solirubrobacteraceae bacterium]|jgi:putative oxidoreductase|nr:DoxX family protein [Solirubrobacteraceae bacterium]